MKIKKFEAQDHQYGHKPLIVNDKLSVENHEYIFETLTKVSPSIAWELILEFIDDYSFIKKESQKVVGYSPKIFPFDIGNALNALKSIAEALKEITVTQDADGFVFGNYKPFLQIVSDNGFCTNRSDELYMIILDYTTFKLRELSIDPNEKRAKTAFEVVIFMEAFADGVKEIRHVPIFNS